MAKQEKETAVAVVAAPDMQMTLGELQGEFAGSVTVRQSLIKIPTIKLNQQMSDAVAGDLGSSGDFTCMSSGKNFGPSINIIPLTISESASLMDKVTSTVKCRSNDLIRNNDGALCSQCPHGQYWNDWGSKEKPKSPECHLSLDMVVVTPEDLSLEGRYQFSFRRTSHPAGKAIINLVSKDARKVPFGSAYSLHSSQETNPKIKKTYYLVNPLKVARTPLTDEQIVQVIPAAKQTLELKRSGRLAQEEVAVTDEESTPF